MNNFDNGDTEHSIERRGTTVFKAVTYTSTVQGKILKTQEKNNNV